MGSPSAKEALLPCPFCGQGSTYRDPYRGGEWSHDVPGCFLNGVYIAGRHSIEQWNTRAALRAQSEAGQ
jgi:hypothetical protein